MPNMNEDQSFRAKWDNEFLMRDSAASILKAMAQDRDILVFGDIDEMLSAEGFKQFDP
jgi:hypothetical protein